MFMLVFFFQAEDGIRDADVTGVQTCALPIFQPDSVAGILPAFLLGRLEACQPGQAWKPIFQSLSRAASRLLALPRVTYFGASKATIASKRESPRSGSQSGLRRRSP